MPGVRPMLEPLEGRDLPAAPYQTLPIFPHADLAVADHVRSIAVEAQVLGRNSNAFLKIGDSNSELFGENAYLRPLGEPGFNPATSGLANYGQSFVDTWAMFHGSYRNFTMAAYPGHKTGEVLAYLPAAIAGTNPGTALIMIGTNDATAGTPVDHFRYRYESIVTHLLDAKIVPVLSTLPESYAFGDTVTVLTRAFNQVIADLAETYRVPLWNFNRQLAALPSSGLSGDRLHLNVSPNGGDRLSGGDLNFGQNVHNLGALTMLDWYRQTTRTVPPVQPMPAWTSLLGHSVYAVGLDRGQAPIVSIYDTATRRELNRFYAFEPSFTGGVRVATGDVNGDSIPDIVCGAGPSGGPVVAVFSGKDGSRLANFLAYEGSFRGGVGSVAVRDLDGDGLAEIAVGAGNGGGPAVAVFSGGTFEERQRFFAYDSSFRGGVNVALGHFEGLGFTIIAGAGIGGAGHVKLFRAGSTEATRSFLVDQDSFRGGIAVASGDFTGDGWDELVTGRAAQGSGVACWDPNTQAVLRRLSFSLGNPLSGVRLGAVANGSMDTLLIASGPGSAVQVDGYTSLDANPESFLTQSGLRSYGLYVG